MTSGEPLGLLLLLTSVGGTTTTVENDAPYPLLSLEEWREILGFHPFHFHQLANNLAPLSSSCNALVYQYNWQNADAAGRAEISQALIDAQNQMLKYLNYAPAPHYRVETIQYPRYPDQRFENRGYAAPDSRWRTLQLSEGHIQAVGTETLVEQNTAAVVYSDTDGDGLNDTFTLTVATDVTDPDEIAVYFADTDRLDGENVGERWRIRPVTVAISGGVATVKGRAWLLVKPILYEGVAVDAIDPSNAANFVTELEVYRHYTSAGTDLDTAQAVLVWETRPWPEWALLTTASPTDKTDPAGEAFALARAGIRDAANGIVTIGESVYDPATGEWNLARNYGYWCRPPDRVIIRYQAGIPQVKGRMDSRYRTILAGLAAAELARPICACDTANRKLYDLQFDLSRAGGVNDEQYATSDDVLKNPFGPRRGAVKAWRFIEDNMIIRGCAPS